MSNITNFFEYPSNYSNGTAVGGIGDWFAYTNHILGDTLGIGIIIMIWLLSFGVSLMLGTKKAILAASFISFVFAVYLAAAGVLNNLMVIIVLLVLMIIGALGSMGSGSGSSP